MKKDKLIEIINKNYNYLKNKKKTEYQIEAAITRVSRDEILELKNKTEKKLKEIIKKNKNKDVIELGEQKELYPSHKNRMPHERIGNDCPMCEGSEYGCIWCGGYGTRELYLDSLYSWLLSSVANNHGYDVQRDGYNLTLVRAIKHDESKNILGE